MIPNEKCDLSEGEVAFLILLFRLCAQAEFFSDLFEGSPLAVFGFLRAFGEEFHQFLVLGGGFHFFGEVVAFADIKGAPIAERKFVVLFHADTAALLVGFKRLRRTGLIDLALRYAGEWDSIFSMASWS